MFKTKEIILKSRPEGLPTSANFGSVTRDLAAPASGEVLVKNLFMSVDPYMRGRMNDQKSYVPPFVIGEALSGGAVGEVVQSRNPAFSPGDLVESFNGWREYFLAPASALSKLPTIAAAPSAFLGVLGMPGLTAYVGLLKIAGLKAGESVFISGAAGAVGSIAGQIAKIKGCHVTGSAGSEAKVKWLRELGFDSAFNYKNGDILGQLEAAAPGGIDVYFDNVGGEHLEAALSHLKVGGRIAMCGAISGYNLEHKGSGPSNLFLAIVKELSLIGFLVSKHGDMRPAFLKDVGGWLEKGLVTFDETIYKGIDQAVPAFLGLFNGANQGKMLVEL